MERGCWAQTKGAELMLEHGSWLSIFSGIPRARHGFYYFRQLQPGSYDLKLIYGPEVKAPAFWAPWQDGRKRIVVIDVPEGALQSRVPGLQIANWAVHRGYVSRAAAYKPKSEPTGLLDELIRKFGSPEHIVEAPNAGTAQNRRMRLELLARVERKGALCRYLIERERADLVVCCFGESHTAGHQFWRYCAEGSGHRPSNGAEFADAIRDVYQAIDRQLGLLLSKMPPSTNVVVLSSIGLADHYPTGALMDAFCRRLGYQASAEISSRPMSILRRLVPEKWRVAVSRYLSREKREELFAQQFRDHANWRKTSAFSIPSIYSGFLRVNLRGREPEGIVEPGAEYEEVLDRLENDLRQVIDPKTGQPAIEKVVRVGDLYGCKPPDVLPDLLVHWKPATHFLDRVVHPKAELTQEKPSFFGTANTPIPDFSRRRGPPFRSGVRLIMWMCSTSRLRCWRSWMNRSPSK